MYLKEFREGLKLTQRELAEILEIAQTTIARYENDKVKPTSTVIEKYIWKLNANPNYLFLGELPYTTDDKDGHRKAVNAFETNKENSAIEVDFSKKISIIQKELRLSQKDFAEKIELSQNAISQYLTGKRKPDINTVQKLISLGVSPLFLFGIAEEPFDLAYNLFVKAKQYNNEALITIIDEFVFDGESINDVLKIVQRQNSRNFFSEIYFSCQNSGKEFMTFMDSFLFYLEASNKFEKMSFNDVCMLFNNYVTNSGNILNVYGIAESVKMDEVSELEIFYCINDIRKVLEKFKTK